MRPAYRKVGGQASYINKPSNDPLQLQAEDVRANRPEEAHFHTCRLTFPEYSLWMIEGRGAPNVGSEEHLLADSLPVGHGFTPRDWV